MRTTRLMFLDLNTALVLLSYRLVFVLLGFTVLFLRRILLALSHVGLTWGCMELTVALLLRVSGCSLGHSVFISFWDVLGALIRAHHTNRLYIVRLLEYLLTSSDILKIATTVGWKLSLLLFKACIVVIFLWDWILLGRCLLTIVETGLRLHGMRAVWVRGHQSHVVVSSRTWSFARILTALEGLIRNSTWVLWASSMMPKALMIATSHLLTDGVALRLLQLGQGVLLRVPSIQSVHFLKVRRSLVLTWELLLGIVAILYEFCSLLAFRAQNLLKAVVLVYLILLVGVHDLRIRWALTLCLS